MKMMRWRRYLWRVVLEEPCGFPAMTALLTGTASGAPGRYQHAGGKTEAREGEGSPEDASLRARGFQEMEASFLPFHQTHGN